MTVMQARSRMQVSAYEMLGSSQRLERQMAYAWIDVAVFWGTLWGVFVADRTR